MPDLFSGQLGHLLVVSGFIFALAAAFAYYLSFSSENGKEEYRKFGRVLFILHGISALGVIASLFFIIYQHQYQYHYAWSHSSNNLPVYYMISCFWEGQEGSFLLWIFWNLILGAVLVIKHPKWEAEVMMVFLMVQAFLGSMILGVVTPGIDLKIGSSPFILLREFMQEAPVFASNPNFIPEDGTGLNPLLQNYWMVIHPPVTFLGFAACLIPFSFMIAGIMRKDYKGWILYAQPWALFASFFLGLGIIMGGYWAYETLNFGGYWNWDPVENAVYIPWLVLIASVHTLFSSKRYGTALRVSMVLVTATFILILYSTFLTRSGILGDTSVHSFTDLGLSGQLLIYLLFFLGFSVFMIARAWKHLPDEKKEINYYSKEFWVFAGATVLLLASLQVFFTTSIPVFNSIWEALGMNSNLAPPADPMEHYGNAQIWFAIGVAILSGLGPFYWWNKLDWNRLKDLATPAVVITLIISGIVLLSSSIKNIPYILLLTAGIFSVTANLFTLQKLYKAGLKLTGGSLSHIGLGILLVGILFSSGYSKIVSNNLSGKIYHEDFPEDLNLKNVLLWRGKTLPMDDFTLTYVGPRVKSRKGGFMLDRDNISYTSDPDKVILNYDPPSPADILGKENDTVRIFGADNYYELQFFRDSVKAFTLFPRAQINPDMGGLIASPDIKKFFSKDLYAHVSSIVDPNDPPEWEKKTPQMAGMGEDLFLKDHPAIFERVETMTEIAGHRLDSGDVGVKAFIRVFGPGQEEVLEPIFIIHDNMIGRVPAVSRGLGIKILIEQIIPEENKFKFAVETTQADYVILKAMEKPWINLLWGGTLLCLFGMILSMNRRFKDLRSAKD